MNLPDRFFLTGTDTDVGKTITAAVLCEALGLDYWKPIQSGTLEGTDTRTVQSLTHARCWPEAYRFTQPVSPHRAALADHQHIELEHLSLPPASRLLVEGAGGWMVPISLHPWRWTSELVRHWRLPVVLVARSGLGTLNHTFLTLRAIHEDGCVCAGLVLVGDLHPDNAADLAAHGAPVLLRLPRLEPAAAHFAELVALAKQGSA